MSNSNKRPANDDHYEGIQVVESKFWRKVKQDPVVPIGMAGFGVIVIGAIIGFNRRDRTKPTSTYWSVQTSSESCDSSCSPLSIRIRTRVFAQGFVVSLMVAAAAYHALKDTPKFNDSHNHRRDKQDPPKSDRA